jgi:hypothetical protein
MEEVSLYVMLDAVILESYPQLLVKAIIPQSFEEWRPSRRERLAG